VFETPLYLPKTVLLTAWDWEGHGTPPAVLGPDNLWLADDTKKKLDDAVLDTLAELNLAAGGTLTREFRDLLRVLATGPLRFTAWLGDIESKETGNILVSASGPDAVRVVRQDDKVRIDLVDPGYGAEALVDLLPPVEPARIDSASIPKSRFSGRPVYEDSYDLADPTAEPEYDPLPWARELMAAKRTGVHQLYAVNNGTRSTPLTVVDAAHIGRILTYLVPGENGELLVRFESGSRDVLVDVLYATLHGLK
jgi:hypothetical protein